MNQNDTLEKSAEEAFITGTSIMQIDPTAILLPIQIVSKEEFHVIYPPIDDDDKPTTGSETK